LLPSQGHILATMSHILAKYWKRNNLKARMMEKYTPLLLEESKNVDS